MAMAEILAVRFKKFYMALFLYLMKGMKHDRSHAALVVFVRTVYVKKL